MQPRMDEKREGTPGRPGKGVGLDQDQGIAKDHRASLCERQTNRMIKTILRYQTTRVTLSCWTDTLKSATSITSRMVMRA